MYEDTRRSHPDSEYLALRDALSKSSIIFAVRSCYLGSSRNVPKPLVLNTSVDISLRLDDS